MSQRKGFVIPEDLEFMEGFVIHGKTKGFIIRPNDGEGFVIS